MTPVEGFKNMHFDTAYSEIVFDEVHRVCGVIWRSGVNNKHWCALPIDASGRGIESRDEALRTIERHLK